MNEITVTLPDGSSRRVPAGTTPGDIAAAISPRLAKAALAAAVDDRLVDLSSPLQQDARVRIVTPDSPEGLHVYRHSTAHLLAAAVTNLFPGAQCGIGPATDEGFFYDFVVDRPFVPEDLDAIEKKMKELASQDLPYERQMWSARRGDAVLRVARRAAQSAADRREDGRAAGGVVLHDQGPRHVRGFLRRPARPFERTPQGVQAPEHLERVLEGGCAQPADAAHLRHGVLQRQGAAGASAAARRGEEARPPQARTRARPVHVPPVGARRDVLARQGARRSTTRWPATCARCCSLPATSNSRRR